MRSCLAIAVLAYMLSHGHAQAADARVSFLAEQLAKSKDPRTRVLAAAGLGRSKQVAAVKPLCAGLADPDETVRISVVKALGTLAPMAEAVACLRSPGKQGSAVREEIAFILEPIEAAAGTRARLYVSMAPVTDKSGKLGPKVLRLAERKLRAKIASMGGVLAPQGEAAAAAKKVLQSRKLKGYHLQVQLDRTAKGGLLINIACFTYPSLGLLGAVKMEALGAGPEDLLPVLAPQAVEEAASTFNWKR